MKNIFLGKYKELMSQKLHYGTKALYTKFELDLRERCKDPRKIDEVLEILYGPKHKVFNILKF